MRSILSGFPTERVMLYKLSGERIANIKALIDSDMFFVEDATIIIEEGDFFERSLSNTAKEYYSVIDRGFYRGAHGTPDHYQVRVKKVKREEMERILMQSTELQEILRKPQKLFISHSSKDKDYMVAFVELLEDIGMPDGAIVCSSVPGHGIPGGTKIYDWLREQFVSCDLRVVFALSKNYYESPACLNEMGAAWITRATDTLMLLPGFGFSDIRGCVDPSEVGMKLDGDEAELKHRLDELKDTLLIEHNLPSMTGARWERHRNSFIGKIRKIEEVLASQEDATNDENVEYIARSSASEQMPQSISVESAFLVVYAANADGRIFRVQSLTGITVSAAGKTFMKDYSPRETAKWESAIDDLISWSWIKQMDKKGELFALTNKGYQMADMLKEQMEINVQNAPLDEMKEFGE